TIPIVSFPEDGTSVQDTPKLTLVVLEPDSEWTPACAGTADRASGSLRQQIAEWTKQRGKSPRLYPGSLVWCLKKPGRDFREKVELWLAWKRVHKEITEGTLGGDFDRVDRAEIQSKVSDAEEGAKDEVWGGYRFAVIADNKEPDGLKTIDLGAGHSSGAETLCGRVITALKSQALLNESVGASYIERNWPSALKDSGAWPLASLRQSFLNGSLTRLLDPDAVLRTKIVEFVLRGDFGLASGKKPEGGYERVWFNEPLSSDEISFESGVFLLLKSKAKSLKIETEPIPGGGPEPIPEPEPEPPSGQEPVSGPSLKTFRIIGNVPPEVWNRFGTKVLPKLRSGTDLKIGIDFSVSMETGIAKSFETELKQILDDLGLSDRIEIE
ncbi:MAG: AAA family ATPase, partial [Proteobacteria bacterium]|nr:AAA family ATPase [Pseudomonadota bacterium]